ncbi:MAG: hypothetical protein UY21_C0003G0035 [Microgenomates group bacterium GW2011_GWA1_48_10]|nr:MAG: hypothetical protein UY21_C0003G0035 [Microgenomates group bacterium GW2011_GWA1_48_10]
MAISAQAAQSIAAVIAEALANDRAGNFTDLLYHSRTESGKFDK